MKSRRYAFHCAQRVSVKLNSKALNSLPPSWIDLTKARRNADIPAFFFSSGTDDWADMGGNTIKAYLNIKNPILKPVVHGRGREVREES